jgi:hypothetical protein
MVSDPVGPSGGGIFYGPQLAALESTRLSDFICRNTSLTKIQDNVFFYDDTTLAGLVAKTGFGPTALIKPAPAKDSVPTLDGKLNDPFHTTWGVAGAELMRFASAAYSDGLSKSAVSTRPSARASRRSLLRYQENRHGPDLHEPIDLRLSHGNIDTQCAETNLHAELRAQAHSTASQIKERIRPAKNQPRSAKAHLSEPLKAPRG